MSEQEKLQQEKLAIEALEEISGGTITKDDAKKYLNDAKELGKKHWKKIAALGALLISAGVEYTRDFNDAKFLLAALDNLKERLFSE